jgi:hypothetical protein
MAKSNAAAKPASASRARRARKPKLPVSGAVPWQPRMTREQERQTVEESLGMRVPLADYRPTVTALTNDERELLIDQAQVMLEQVFVHLPLKRAMHGTDPVQRLRLLRLRHKAMDERAFQSEMADIFIQLRDLHTVYILPKGYRGKFAFLPFRIEEFYENGPASNGKKIRRYMVTWVSPVNTVSSLKEQVVVTHWNGSPIELAVARNAAREAGSNPEARRAQGVEALTLRWLGMSLPPDEDWVTLTYTDGKKTYESKFQWEVIDAKDRRELLAGLGSGSAGSMAGAALGIDLKTTLLQRVRRLLFDPRAMRLQEEMAAFRSADEAAKAEAEAEAPPHEDASLFPDVFPRFGKVDTPFGPFGYVRLSTFAPESEDVEGTVREFGRILSLLPATGLILDVRGNGGGYVAIGERILQMITPREIVPEPFHFLATPLTLAMAKGNNWLAQWGDPIAQGIETGASFSQGFPLTSPESCNDVGQVYQGPVVLITDARCYSTTDIFAAGFQDHEVGTIIGVHNNTGAGGANVWNHADVLQRLVLPQNPFRPLPQEAGMTVAVRRSTRVGARSGVPLEDLGVVPDKQHYMTRDDVINHNVDLIAHAAEILHAARRYGLRLTRVAEMPVQKLKAEVLNLDRIDVLVDGRTVLTQDVAGQEMEISLPASAPPGGTVRGNGYSGGKLVVSTRVM